MNVYVHKVSSFNEPCGPMVYRTLKLRKNNEFEPGDLIVLVGTGKAAIEDRGRMLGMMETAAIDVEGNERWRFGVANRAAWRFPNKPKFPLPNDPKRFQSIAGQQAILLDANEAAVVLTAVPLEGREVVPLEVGAEHPRPKLISQRTGAPSPSQSRAAAMAVSTGSASTYLFLLWNVKKELVGFKIGWAIDHERRLADFNLVALPGLGGLRYSLGRHWVWDTAQQAYEMEQAVLKCLHKYLSKDNQEVLCLDARRDLESVWAFHLPQSNVK